MPFSVSYYPSCGKCCKRDFTRIIEVNDDYDLDMLDKYMSIDYSGVY